MCDGLFRCDKDARFFPGNFLSTYYDNFNNKNDAALLEGVFTGKLHSFCIVFGSHAICFRI